MLHSLLLISLIVFRLFFFYFCQLLSSFIFLYFNYLKNYFFLAISKLQIEHFMVII